MSLARQAALLTIALSSSLALASCGDGVVERPAHRPISVVYITGDPDGPWAERTEGLADGAKLAVAERDGLIGERAVSTAVVPTEQRDGDQVSAAIGGGRILRDSRTLAVLSAYSAAELPLAAPQLNGGELALFQFGSGMTGLTAPEAPGEPGRYEPSGGRLAVRGVPSDTALAGEIKTIKSLQGAQVVALTGAFRKQQALDEKARIARDQKAADKQAEEDGEPKTTVDPSLTAPSPVISDADRLAARIASALGGSVVSVAQLDPGKATVVVTDPAQADPTIDAAVIGKRIKAPLLAVDAADRPIAPAPFTGRTNATYTATRTLADITTPQALKIRAAERKAFGRDRGDAVVAGYLAAKRMMDLAAAQPDKTIDRTAYAEALTAASEGPDYPVTTTGEALLGQVQLFELRGGKWAPL